MALLLTLACLGTLLPFKAGAQPASSDTRARYAEDEVKAAFLFHFATYVEWAGDEDAVITFAVLRAPDVADELERFVGERRVQGREVVVRRLRSIRELEGDEVLFIGSSQNRRLRQLTRAVKGPTLIVTDAPHGLPDGVGAPNGSARPADDLDSFDVLEQGVLCIPEHTGVEWRIDTAAVDQHQQLVRQVAAESAHGYGPRMSAVARHLHAGGEAQGLGQAGDSGP